jgi:hypothetical protein
VAHPCHEFPRIRARIRRELVASMAQVVDVHLRQPDRREPHPTPSTIRSSTRETQPRFGRRGDARRPAAGRLRFESRDGVRGSAVGIRALSATVRLQSGHASALARSRQAHGTARCARQRQRRRNGEQQ